MYDAEFERVRSRSCRGVRDNTYHELCIVNADQIRRRRQLWSAKNHLRTGDDSGANSSQCSEEEGLVCCPLVKRVTGLLWHLGEVQVSEAIVYCNSVMVSSPKSAFGSTSRS